jgi:hypothetical protein
MIVVPKRGASATPQWIAPDFFSLLGIRLDLLDVRVRGPTTAVI